MQKSTPNFLVYKIGSKKWNGYFFLEFHTSNGYYLSINLKIIITYSI
uniref:Uncharacterized protein n=1 Tax=uncultured Desulfobacterium sp. TaxID=201089 RepID=E1YDS0_9BACT|nr:unknown protein [uncultured Desulfobacterium sp.]